MKAVGKIWKEFEKARWEYEIVRGEDRKADEEWGCGKLEE